MTAEAETFTTQKILARAPALDDMKNRLAAFVGASAKTGVVQWLVYMDEDQFNELNKPGYITITAENGGRLHDF